MILVDSCMSSKYVRKKRERGKRRQSSIPDDIYNALIKIVEGQQLPPVKIRTEAENNAIVRFWRSKGDITLKIENGKKLLYCKGRRLLRSSEINNVVTEQFHRTKGSGAAKIVYSLRDNLIGLSRKKVQEILNSDKFHYKRNAKFYNKATLNPIRARDVQSRHHIDLMDLGKSGMQICVAASYGGKEQPRIAKALRDIYYGHGPPRVIQCDQGTEFKGAIRKLCQRFEIKIICGRPYHPQSQGKVERSDKTLRAKMEYDLAKMCDEGINWARGLPIYQRILNEDPKE
ncbi:uncharacterized protein LOC116294878, partial [Actinia tenebrosa]|uniref:Uncharacterized protein LOC116294878 n=1 Tax=Actinia tenebrosa TaxID=6105 RepID=A0A6P8HT70_ACTTE